MQHRGIYKCPIHQEPADLQLMQDVATRTGYQHWQGDFFQNVDLVTLEPECRFVQPGIIVSTQREKIIIDTVNGLYSGLDEKSLVRLTNLACTCNLHFWVI